MENNPEADATHSPRDLGMPEAKVRRKDNSPHHLPDVSVLGRGGAAELPGKADVRPTAASPLLVERRGDLLTALESKEAVIVHQTNCVTTAAKGLAQTIFERIPRANVYKTGENKRASPGSILVKERVVALFGQHLPGKPGRGETKAQRLTWFRAGLENLKKYVRNPESKITEVCFPQNIGCALAGGNWEDYRREIKDFARGVSDAQNADGSCRSVKVVIYAL